MKKQQSQSGVIGAILVAGAMIAGAILLSSPDNTASVLTPPEVPEPAKKVEEKSLEELLNDFEQYEEFDKRMEEFLEATGTPSEARSGIITATADELADDDPYLGDEDAPLVIAEFSDFQCPFCKRHLDNAFVQIKKNYIDTGKVKYVFRDYPLYGHSQAKPAALAAGCVFDQLGNEAYFTMHKRLFEHQRSLSHETITRLAHELDIDSAIFDTCYTSQQFDAEIEADLRFGESVGVEGTPGFVVGNTFIRGAQSYEHFKQAIEAQLP